MRDGWTGADPYPEDNGDGEQFKRDARSIIAYAREIVLAPAADAPKYSVLCRAQANVIVYLAEVLKENGIVV